MVEWQLAPRGREATRFELHVDCWRVVDASRASEAGGRKSENIDSVFSFFLKHVMPFVFLSSCG